MSASQSQPLQVILILWQVIFSTVTMLDAIALQLPIIQHQTLCFTVLRNSSHFSPLLTTVANLFLALSSLLQMAQILFLAQSVLCLPQFQHHLYLGRSPETCPGGTSYRLTVAKGFQSAADCSVGCSISFFSPMHNPPKINVNLLRRECEGRQSLLPQPGI